MPEISDERLDELLAWAQREQREFADDDMPVSAQHHADLATLIAEVKVARAGKGVGGREAVIEECASVCDSIANRKRAVSPPSPLYTGGAMAAEEAAAALRTLKDNSHAA